MSFEQWLLDMESEFVSFIEDTVLEGFYRDCDEDCDGLDTAWY